MALLEWNETLETGIEIVDAQHRRLVELVNEVAPSLADPRGTDSEKLTELFAGLLDYAAVHFRDEEQVMRDAGVAAAHQGRHVESHLAFVADVTRWRSEIGGTTGVTGPMVLRFLSNWLVLHILGDDQSMARQIAMIRAGSTPEEALAKAEQSDRSAAERLLSATLTDFYSLLNQRNRTLIAVNTELTTAKHELSAINTQLEARVVERTEKLAAAKARLEQEHGALKAAHQQLEQAQRQLLQSEKMAAVGQLAAGVAHEINNPVGFVTSNLNSLEGYAKRLFAVLDADAAALAALPPEHPAASAAAQARQAAELDFLREDLPELLAESAEGLARVRKIVADLKDFSHVDESEWQEADINKGLESTLNVVWNELKYKAEVVRHFGELPRLRCLPAQLNQVFMNMLVNAAHAIDTRGTITLTTHCEAGEVCIEIADTGKGIPPETVSRIFEPFFTTKPVGKGTGLGLSISYDIVNRHGGRIDVDSAPGRGTRFLIRLPLVRAADDAANLESRLVT